MNDRKEYYQKNKEQYLEHSRNQKNRARIFVNKIKNENKCLFCRESDFSCLDFHHKNPNEKDIDISVLIKNHASIETLSNEIKKCVVLCANCHRKIHHYILPKA